MTKQFKKIIFVLLLSVFSLILISCVEDDNNIEKYIVTFNTDGGTLIEDIFVEKGRLVKKPEDPTKDGYEFDSWYREINHTNKWDFTLDTVSESLTLYAKWNLLDVEKVEYKVSFESNGGTLVTGTKVIEDSKLIKPTDPTKDGYIFLGWFKEEELTNAWDFDTDKVNNDLTLYAKWGAKVESDWTLVNNSQLKNVFNDTNLKLFNHKKYEVDGSIVDEYESIEFNGIFDRNIDLSKRESSIAVNFIEEERKAYLYQKDDYLYSVLEFEDDLDGIKMNAREDDYRNIFGVSIEDINDMFESILLNLVDDSNQELVDGYLKLYKKGNQYKLVISGGLDNHYMGMGFNMDLTLIITNDIITEIDINLNTDIDGQKANIQLSSKETDKNAIFNHDLSKITDEDLYYEFEIVYEDGKSSKHRLLESEYYAGYIERKAIEEGYEITGIYTDKSYTKLIDYSGPIDINEFDTFYVKREKIETSFEIIDKVLKTDNYTIQLDLGDLLVTKNYILVENVFLYDIKNNILYAYYMDEVTIINNSSLFPYTSLTLSNYFNKTPIKHPEMDIYLGNNETLIMYDRYHNVFTFGYEEYNGEGYVDIEFEEFMITEISTTVITEEMLNVFLNKESNEDHPNGVYLINQEVVFFDTKDGNNLKFDAVIEFGFTPIKVRTLAEIEAYGITYEKEEEYNMFKYVFSYEGREIGYIFVLTYDSSRGSILINPYFKGEKDEILYYYINELEDIPFELEEDELYVSIMTYKDKDIITLDDLKAIKDQIIFLDTRQVVKDAEALFNHLKKFDIMLYSYDYHIEYKINLLNKSIQIGRSYEDTYVYREIDGIFYFSDSSGMRYYQYNEANIKKYLNQEEIEIYDGLIKYYNILKLENFKVTKDTITIEGIGSVRNDDIYYGLWFENFDISLNDKDKDLEESFLYFTISEVYETIIIYEEIEDLKDQIFQIFHLFSEYIFYLEEELLNEFNMNEINFDEIDELILYHEFKEDYLDNYDEFLELVLTYNTFTLSGSFDNYMKVGLHVIEYHDGENKYVIDRATQIIYLDLTDKLIETNFKNIFDLQYLLKEYITMEKKYEYGWDYTYQLSDRKVIIQNIDENGMYVIVTPNSTLNGVENYFHFEFKDINKTNVADYNFKEAIKDEILDVKIFYNRLTDITLIESHLSFIVNYTYTGERSVYPSYELYENKDYTIKINENNIIIKILDEEFTFQLNLIPGGVHIIVFWNRDLNLILTVEEFRDIASLKSIYELLEIPEELYDKIRLRDIFNDQEYSTYEEIEDYILENNYYGRIDFIIML